MFYFLFFFLQSILFYNLLLFLYLFILFSIFANIILHSIYLFSLILFLTNTIQLLLILRWLQSFPNKSTVTFILKLPHLNHISLHLLNWHYIIPTIIIICISIVIIVIYDWRRIICIILLIIIIIIVCVCFLSVVCRRW